MSDKYIIRNCPAIYGIDDGFLCSYRQDEESEKYCYDCTDCVLKQIIEKCKNELQVQNNWWCGAKPLAQEILQLLQIEEVE